MSPFLCGKSTLTPDLPLLQRLPVIRQTIAAYSKDNDGLSGILRGIESVYDVDGQSLEFDKILDFILHIMTIGCDSLLYSNRIRTARIANALSRRYPEQVQDTIRHLTTSKRKSIQNVFAEKGTAQNA